MSDSGSETTASFDWRTRFLGCYQDDLPRWVVEHGRYAVTFRCAGSLPASVVLRIEEQRRLLERVPAQSEAAENARRRLFLVLEGFLDGGKGFAPFRESPVAAAFDDWLREYDSEGLTFSDFVIMPNHLHLVTRPLRLRTLDEFREVWRRFKGRSARFLNQHLERSGGFWQSYGYDRWIRSESELRSWQRYLARNPVKAGLCTDGDLYPFLHLES
jgi:REP element-mobilizing transposase RayT